MVTASRSYSWAETERNNPLLMLLATLVISPLAFAGRHEQHCRISYSCKVSVNYFTRQSRALPSLDAYLNKNQTAEAVEPVPDRLADAYFEYTDLRGKKVLFPLYKPFK